jgi:uncharacterized membrane protein required for colicin V production
MMPLDAVFWLLVTVFGVMGALRGWAKEVLVSFSVIVALFLRLVFSKYVPFAENFLTRLPAIEQFYLYGVLVILMAVVGYAGPVVSARLAGKAAREKLQDVLLGAILGGLNGYLIIGTLWYFLHAANYGVLGIQAPAVGSTAEILASEYLILAWLSDPMLLTIVAFAFVFVLIVFL